MSCAKMHTLREKMHYHYAKYITYYKEQYRLAYGKRHQGI